mgnify:FL=1
MEELRGAIFNLSIEIKIRHIMSPEERRNIIIDQLRKVIPIEFLSSPTFHNIILEQIESDRCGVFLRKVE